ncbi:MAG: hypothetical protein ABI779_23185 [Acidobacteriota bacterium]
MLADIGQEMGENMNAIVHSNDQIFRDIFGEGMDTMFRRPETSGGHVGGRPVHHQLPTRPSRLIEEGAIDAELIEDEPRSNSRLESAPDVLEAEIVTEDVDRETQVVSQTSASVRAAAQLGRPRTAAELIAQAIADMRARRSAITAYRRAKIEETRAFIRRRR